jgi:hypothetical protein
MELSHYELANKLLLSSMMHLVMGGYTSGALICLDIVSIGEYYHIDLKNMLIFWPMVHLVKAIKSYKQFHTSKPCCPMHQLVEALQWCSKLPWSVAFIHQ